MFLITSTKTSLAILFTVPDFSDVLFLKVWFMLFDGSVSAAVNAFLVVCKVDTKAMSGIDDSFCAGNALSVMFSMLISCPKTSCDELKKLLLIKESLA